MAAEDDDVLGDVAPRRKRGRPSNNEIAERQAARHAALEQGLRASQLRVQGKAALGDPYAIQAGVNITWLCQAFRMDIKTVRRKLANLEPIGIGQRNVEIYDFKDAASFLAKPPPNQLAEFLRGLRVQDLPVHLQDPYWSAMRKKQIYELHAGQLWKTEDVHEVFADVNKTIKAATQLWVDNLDGQTALTNEQRVLLIRMVDSLLDDIYARLIEMPRLKQTGSLAASPEANPSGPDPVADDDDEDMIG